MKGMMMDVPLLIPSVLRHAVSCHGDAEIVSRTVEGPIHRYTYADAGRRICRLANALKRLGLQSGDRVGTLAWNGYRHLELYYAVSGAGMVCHTINPRLFSHQVAFIINHAEDSFIFVDLTFLGLLEQIADEIKGLRGVVVMTDAAHMPGASKLPNLLCYETLLEGEADRFDWPDMDENTASSLCYTSGTTGHPKGVLYSHRSSVLHAMAVCMPDVFCLSANDVVLPVVPMFHVNAWGVPYAGPMAGAKLVLPGPRMDGASLHELIVAEGVTCTAGVPTVWMALLSWAREHGKSLAPLERVAIGGAAAPAIMIEQFADAGIRVIHAWGMTETSPVGLVNSPKPKHRALAKDERLALAVKQGRPVFGAEFQALDVTDHEVKRDGKSVGRLLVRGPWVCSSYYGMPQSDAHAVPGWFETGDMVTVDPDGYFLIVDRTKDVIKSGGEWISSIELENIAVAHPAVREAAAISYRDPKWSERPLLLLVLKEGAMLTKAEMQAFYEGKAAKWCVPDEIVIVDQLPHTATGKLQKSSLRAIYKDYQPGAGIA